jgi:hypothetical protein
MNLNKLDTKPSPHQQSERNLSAAITALIDQEYGDGDSFFQSSRDYVAVGDTQVRISYEVYANLLNELYESGTVFTFAPFDNCREYGLTIDAGNGWIFCVYEHRNSDQIQIQGCPAAEVRPYGPYGDADKWDTLASFEWREYYATAVALASMIRRTVNDPNVTRAQLKALKGTAQ